MQNVSYVPVIQDSFTNGQLIRKTRFCVAKNQYVMN